LNRPGKIHVPEDLDPCLPKDVLKVFDLATQQVRFTPDSAAATAAQNFIPLIGDSAAEVRAESNNWVISDTI